MTILATINWPSGASIVLRSDMRWAGRSSVDENLTALSAIMAKWANTIPAPNGPVFADPAASWTSKIGSKRGGKAELPPSQQSPDGRIH